MSPYDKAQAGLHGIEESILELLSIHSGGLQNSKIARLLGLESDQDGKQKDYLTWSILGLMIKRNAVERLKIDGKMIYRIKALTDINGRPVFSHSRQASTASSGSDG